MPKSIGFYYLTKLQRAIELLHLADEYGEVRDGELILTLLEMVDVYLARRFTEELEAAGEGS